MNLLSSARACFLAALFVKLFANFAVKLNINIQCVNCSIFFTFTIFLKKERDLNECFQARFRRSNSFFPLNRAL